jgi:tetratricopeptide (TPR) repeat protein
MRLMFDFETKICFRYISLDECREAQEMYEKLFNKIRDNLNWEANGLIEIQLGNICKEGLYDYEKALEHYLTCLELYCQHISPYDIKLRNIYLSIGHLLLLIGKSENSLSIEYFERVLDIDKLQMTKNENNLINDHNYLGLLYLNESNYSEALFHFDKSLQYFLLINSNENFNEKNYQINQTIYDKKALESLSINKLPNLSEIHFNLATTYQNLGQIQNALKHAQKALQLAAFDQNKFHFYQNYYKKLQQI